MSIYIRGRLQMPCTLLVRRDATPRDLILHNGLWLCGSCNRYDSTLDQHIIDEAILWLNVVDPFHVRTMDNLSCNKNVLL